MPRSAHAVRLAALVLAGVLAFAGGALAEGEGRAHDRAGKITLNDLDVAQRQRARDVFSEIICACPDENWSKALINCPDGCADPQKDQILRAILNGLSDEQIVAAQIEQYGPKVHGKPDDVLTYLLPVLVLAGAVLTVGLVLRRWKSDAAEGHVHDQGGPPVDDAEIAAIERELKELR